MWEVLTMEISDLTPHKLMCFDFCFNIVLSSSDRPSSNYLLFTIGAVFLLRQGS